MKDGQPDPRVNFEHVSRERSEGSRVSERMEEYRRASLIVCVIVVHNVNDLSPVLVLYVIRARLRPTSSSVMLTVLRSCRHVDVLP